MEEILATIMACKQVRQNELTNATNLLKHKYFKRFILPSTFPFGTTSCLSTTDIKTEKIS